MVYSRKKTALSLHSLCVTILLMFSLTSGQWCPQGRFGLDCEGICHCYLLHERCDPQDGRCESGQCSRGWTGPSCQQACGPGRFGLKCSKYCNCPSYDKCDPANGLCQSGVCAAGWGGPSCQTVLPVLSSPPRVITVETHSITLLWRAWSPNHNYVAIPDIQVIGYILEYSSPAEGIKWTKLAEMQPLPQNGNWYQHVVSSLQPDTEYRFRLSLVWVENDKRKVSTAGPMVVTRTAEKKKKNLIVIRPKDTMMSTASAIRLSSDNVQNVAVVSRTTETPRLSTTRAPVENFSLLSRNMTFLSLQLVGQMQYICYFKVMYSVSKSYAVHFNKSETSEKDIDNCHFISLDNLHPATRYRIRVFSRLQEWEHLGYFWTLQENPPVPPQPQVIFVRNDSVVLEVEPVTSFRGPVTAYYLIVEQLKLMKNESLHGDTSQYSSNHGNGNNSGRTKGAEGKMNDIMSENMLIGNPPVDEETDNKKKDNTDNAYIKPMLLNRRYRSLQRNIVGQDGTVATRMPGYEARHIVMTYKTAKLLPRDISKGVNFTVGDGKVYNKVYNKPLIPGNKYNVQYCVESLLDGHKEEACSAVWGLVMLSKMPLHREKNSGPAAGGVFAAVFFVVAPIIVVAIFLGVRFWKRRKASREDGDMMFSPGFTESVVTSTPKPPRYASSEYVQPEEMDKVDAVPVTDKNSFLDKGDGKQKAEDLYSTPNKNKKSTKFQDGENAIPSQPVSVQQLHRHCRAKESDLSGPPLLAEFERLPVGPFGSWDEAQSHLNEPYNRTQEYVPYNYNRVKLTIGPHHITDYINASWFKSGKKSREYIVTQHPLVDTMGDFWQMVWEQDISLLVLLTDMSCENSTLAEPFETFWPYSEPLVYRDVTISLTQRETLANYTIHALELNCLGAEENKIVELFHFHSWNEENVPLHVVCFIQFYQRIKKVTESSDNTAVICETGSVKSGLYVAIDSLIQDASENEQVDVLACVHCLRLSRVGLIDSLDQYEFIYCFLIEFFSKTNRRFGADQLKVATSSHAVKFHMQAEFKRILNHRHNTNMASSLYYQGSQESLSSSQRPFLTPPGKKRQLLYSLPVNTCFQDDQLIVAPSVSSYAVKDLFVLIRTPLEAQFAELWDIVLESQASMIVLLHGNGLCYFWPQKGKLATYGSHEVENLQVKASDGFSQQHLSVRSFSQQPLSARSEEAGVGGTEDLLTLHQLTAWTSKTALPAPPTFLKFLMDAMQIWAETGKSEKVMIVCEDGQQRAGLFCLVWSLLEMLPSDGTVGVYHETRRLEDQIPNFHIDLDSYKYCYQLLELHTCGKQTPPKLTDTPDVSILDDTSVLIVEDLC